MAATRIAVLMRVLWHSRCRLASPAPATLGSAAPGPTRTHLEIGTCCATRVISGRYRKRGTRGRGKGSSAGHLHLPRWTRPHHDRHGDRVPQAQDAARGRCAREHHEGCGRSRRHRRGWPSRHEELPCHPPAQPPLEHAPRTAKNAEDVIDDLADMRNLRDACVKCLNDLEKATTDEGRHEARERGRTYVERCFSLLTFDADIKEQGPKGYPKSLETWKGVHPIRSASFSGSSRQWLRRTLRDAPRRRLTPVRKAHPNTGVRPPCHVARFKSQQDELCGFILATNTLLREEACHILSLLF